ncbi:hypothetical protein FSP39_009915 [Pinctada imbricata]|uniref:ADF-H domain-containing protein n=1 Tax=Pinctada imbricata TaxID=66713 RepID=A0AA88XF87_PINIB|nr:hypothetical protein FSP39_009915 [Pinctada imbricata]
MAMSGVKCDDAVVTEYEDMKMKKKIKFLVLYVEDNKLIKVEREKFKEECPDAATGWWDTFEEFKASLPKDEPRYIVYDYQLDNGVEKLVLMHWNPDNAKVKPKMIYASSIAVLKTKLIGIFANLSCCDMDELEEKRLSAEIVKKMTKKD